MNIQSEAQAIPVANLLKGEIVIGRAQFLLKRHEFKLAASQRVAKKIGELSHRRTGPGGFLINQRAEGVQKIEDEMRVDLRFQRQQFGILGPHDQSQSVGFGAGDPFKQMVEEV